MYTYNLKLQKAIQYIYMYRVRESDNRCICAWMGTSKELIVRSFPIVSLSNISTRSTDAPPTHSNVYSSPHAGSSVFLMQAVECTFLSTVKTRYGSAFFVNESIFGSPSARTQRTRIFPGVCCGCCAGCVCVCARAGCCCGVLPFFTSLPLSSAPKTVDLAAVVEGRKVCGDDGGKEISAW